MSLEERPKDLAVVRDFQVQEFVNDDLHPKIGRFPK
jgi:hypothetical protein